MNNAPTTRFPRGLYGITPDWHDTDQLLEALQQAADGGMTALQWRRKTGDPAARLDQAVRLRELCASLGVIFMVNDSLDTALQLEADGLHMGRDDGSLDEARRALGPNRLLGASCYNQPQLAVQALAAGVDYIALGAVYASHVKPEAAHATLDHLRAAHRLVIHPDACKDNTRAAVVAIGGITAENAAPIIEAGADSIAIISGLFQAPDIKATAARCSALFTPN